MNSCSVKGMDGFIKIKSCFGKTIISFSVFIFVCVLLDSCLPLDCYQKTFWCEFANGIRQASVLPEEKDGEGINLLGTYDSSIQSLFNI